MSKIEQVCIPVNIIQGEAHFPDISNVVQEKRRGKMQQMTKKELRDWINRLQLQNVTLEQGAYHAGEINLGLRRDEAILLRQSEMLAKEVVRLRKELAKYKEAAHGSPAE